MGLTEEVTENTSDSVVEVGGATVVNPVTGGVCEGANMSSVDEGEDVDL